VNFKSAEGVRYAEDSSDSEERENRM